MMKSERENLKEELLHLKRCQIQYFVLSVASAGAIAGFGGKLEHNRAIYLAPLLVILPCWWIFFDKGATITRIVGYFRLLEGMILTNREAPYKYIGWENALSLFREEELKTPLNKKITKYFSDIWKGLSMGLTFQTTHKYWVISWYTFLGLSLTSFWLSYPGGSILQAPFWGTLFCLFVLSTLHNLRVLGRLIRGSYSIVEHHEQWKRVLSSKNAQNFFDDMFPHAAVEP